MKDVWRIYDKVAANYARERRAFNGEQAYLHPIVERLPAEARVLDLGCGPGVPIAQFFIAHGCSVTGVDAAPAMLALFRANCPAAECIEHDMRTLRLDKSFDAIVAWDSF